MKRSIDRVEHCIHLFEHFMVPEAQHSKTMRFQKLRPLQIVSQLPIKAMLLAINLDNQS